MNAQPNGAQHHPQGHLGFSLAFTIVDVDLAGEAFGVVLSGADANGFGHRGEKWGSGEVGEWGSGEVGF